MSDLYRPTDEQMARLSPYFSKSHGKARFDHRRVLGGIIFLNRKDLRWRDAPREYGPPNTLYSHWKRWAALREQGTIPVIPGRRIRKRQIQYDARRNKDRWRVEAMFCRLKDIRRAAARYDKLARNYLSAVSLAATGAFWL